MITGRHGPVSRRTTGVGILRVRFVDYANDDGLFRKYRIVFVEGRPYACHNGDRRIAGISGYLNAGHGAQRKQHALEEEDFMRNFDSGFRRSAFEPHWLPWPIGRSRLISRSTARKTSAENC